MNVHRHPKDLIYVAAGTLILILCALPVDGNRSPAPEPAVFHVINSIPDLFYWPVWVVMQLGNLLAGPAAAVVAAIFKRFRLALALLAVTVGKLYSARIVKDLVFRERPASVIDDVTRRGDASASGQAFVSGHAIIAFAMATVAYRYLPRTWRKVAWGLAAAVCVGRVYVGAHLPLDVIGGGALGWGLGSLLNYLLGTPRFLREISTPQVGKRATESG